MAEKNVVVSGANGGLGYCLTEIHLKKNDLVFALDLKTGDKLSRLKDEFDNLEIIEIDMSDQDSISKASEIIAGKVSKIDYIYNAAAIFYHEDKVPLAETDLEKMVHMLNVNSVGPLRIIKSLLPLIKEKSVIANISSEAASISQCWRKREYAYSMSKTALNMASRILANEMHEINVKVLAIHPGWMRTYMGGEEATYDPAENAGKIIELAANYEDTDLNHMFVDFQGNILPW